MVVVVVPFIFSILVRYETFTTRAQGPVIVIAKEENLGCGQVYALGF